MAADPTVQKPLLPDATARTSVPGSEAFSLADLQALDKPKDATGRDALGYVYPAAGFEVK